MDLKEFLEVMEWRLKCEIENMEASKQRIVKLHEVIEEYKERLESE